ncbi:MAG: ClpX C4-type zinc finger protein [Pseudomonadota bacterium]
MSDRDDVQDLSRFFILLCGRLNVGAHFATIVALSEPMIQLAKELKRTDLEDTARHWQSIALENWKTTRDEPANPKTPHCSFCGKAEPEVKLAAGAGGYICDSCVRILSGAFEGK